MRVASTVEAWLRKGYVSPPVSRGADKKILEQLPLFASHTVNAKLQYEEYWAVVGWY